MRKFFILIILSIWLVGCNTEASKNENSRDKANQTANDNAQNTNGQNSNANVNANAKEAEEKTEDEEVPTFEDAEEALEKGVEYFSKSKNEKAIDAFKQAVELDPDLAEAHFKLGVAYALEERKEDAKVKVADDELAEDPKKKKKKVAKRSSEIAFENAVKTYKKFLRKNPKNAEAYFNLGRAHNKLGEKSDKDARKALERAVKLDQESSLYRTELGAVLNKLAKYPEAIRQLNKAIKLQEDNFRAQDLLQEAKAGKKRVNFGTNKGK